MDRRAGYEGKSDQQFLPQIDEFFGLYYIIIIGIY